MNANNITKEKILGEVKMVHTSWYKAQQRSGILRVLSVKKNEVEMPIV